MNKILLILIVVAVLAVAAGGCAGEKGKSITVFAGSASKPPLEEVARAFERETGVHLYLNFGGSGTMLSQIELSRSGDVYIPGSPDFMVKAEKKGVIDPSSIRRIAYLIPVIAVQKGNPKDIRTLEDLAQPGIEIGIANPESVCVGLYAIEIMENSRLLSAIGKNITVNTESCEKTATVLSLKAVDAVFGWDVFQYWDPENIDVVYINEAQLPRIAYIPGAVTKFAEDRENAVKFLDFLVSEKGRSIFQKWGYITTESEARQFATGAEIGGEYQLPENYLDLMR